MSIPVILQCAFVELKEYFQRYRPLTEFIINRVVFCEHLITNCKTIFHSTKACSLGRRFTC